jgi:hypothetical protein
VFAVTVPRTPMVTVFKFAEDKLAVTVPEITGVEFEIMP